MYGEQISQNVKLAELHEKLNTVMGLVVATETAMRRIEGMQVLVKAALYRAEHVADDHFCLQSFARDVCPFELVDLIPADQKYSAELQAAILASSRETTQSHLSQRIEYERTNIIRELRQMLIRQLQSKARRYLMNMEWHAEHLSALVAQRDSIQALMREVVRQTH
jgi:hypothetical protein